MPDVSIVIPSYNSEKHIETCLQSAIQQKTKVPYEIIVVESGNDKTAKIISEKFPTVKLIVLKQRAYPGKARNIGIKHSAGKIIACTDTDCIVDNAWVDNIYNAHKKHDVVGGRVLNGNPSNIIGWGLFLSEFSDAIGKKSKIIKNMPTCNITYKKKIFKNHGNFKEKGWGSDYKFNAKIKQNIYFSHDVRVKHVNRKGLITNLRHAYELGHGDAIIRKTVKKSSLATKYKFLIPTLLLIHFGNVARKSMQSNYFPAFLLTSPIVFITLIAWYYGFTKGTFAKFSSKG